MYFVHTLLLAFIGLGLSSAEDAGCPHPCTQGGVKYCHPIPCPLPPCVDPVTDQGACCSHCPNGADCRSPDGVPILYHHWRMVDGKNCTCSQPMQDAVCV